MLEWQSSGCSTRVGGSTQGHTCWINDSLPCSRWTPPRRGLNRSVSFCVRHCSPTLVYVYVGWAYFFFVTSSDSVRLFKQIQVGSLEGLRGHMLSPLVRVACVCMYVSHSQHTSRLSPTGFSMLYFLKIFLVIKKKQNISKII